MTPRARSAGRRDGDGPRVPRPHPSRFYTGRLAAPRASWAPWTLGDTAPESHGLGAVIPTITHVDTNQGLVALTFDDGPDPNYTPTKLRALAEHGAAATFFILGSNVDQRPQLVPEIARAGHEIGNHSYGHPDLRGQSYSGVFSQLEDTKQAILRAGGPETTLFRPPYGFFNATVLAAAADDGYRLNVLWDIDPNDWRSPPAWTITEHVLSRVLPGSIILLHDWVPQTAEALPDILDGLVARGLRSVSVSTLLGAPGPAPQPESPYHPRQCRVLMVQTPLQRGDDVTSVQSALRDRGLDPGQVDGVFGPLTSAAVRRFQAGQGLAVTGAVTAEEYRKLGVVCPG